MNLPIDLYGRLGAPLYLRALDRAKREPTGSALREALRNQRLSREAYRQLSLSLLAQTLDYAFARVPRFRSMPGGSDRRGAPTERLEALPVLTKKALFEDFEAYVGPDPVGRVFEAKTSGSTGIALRFLTDGRHLAWANACQLRGRSWWGLRRGARELVLWGRPLEDGQSSGWKARLKYRLRNAIQFNTFESFDDDCVRRILDAIDHHQPEVLYGYGSSLGRVALVASAEGYSPKKAPRLVEYTADHMLPAEKAAAEAVFGAPVLSQYGSSEAGGLAQQCRFGRLHIASDHLHVEFLRDDGTAADPDETSRIVVTTLRNRAMPLLRYEVGDVGSWSEAPCPCGLPLPVMNLELGKAVELISTSERAHVSAHILDYINLYLIRSGIRGIQQYHVTQVSPDGFELRFVPDGHPPERALEVFVEKMRSHLGPGIVVRTTPVDDLPVSASGKRRYFEKTFA